MRLGKGKTIGAAVIGYGGIGQLARCGMIMRLRCLFLILLTLAAGCATPRHGEIYQVSTIDALLAGVYDGEVTFNDLMRHGDFGIGTFDALGGEMIAVDGRAYDVRYDGHVVPVASACHTPFSAVTFFAWEHKTPAFSVTNLAQFAALLDTQLSATNQPYAVRLDGVFDYVRTRSVPPQRRPYPPLVEAAKSQAVFEFRNVCGTLVGFRCPSWMKGLNVTGYHLHFLTADHSGGGHVLEIAFKKLPVWLEPCHTLTVELPRAGDFGAVNLSRDRGCELEKVEK